MLKPTLLRLMVGWADQLLLRASTEHILIVRGLRARKLAARLAFTATPSRRILFLAGIDSQSSCRPDSVATARQSYGIDR